MVMEPPSPQCVGREFVRQYYTVLNKAPLYLHRFYNSNSSFVHGGLDHPGDETKPVVGQTEIHQKIMQLNFRDCHAKIRQVDSHATLSDGVVVQVTGELSNDGEPMRRFMQTFVLAPQTPKKYYVRNDIFRYQDEVFNDDDEMDNQEGTTGSENQLQLTSQVPLIDNQESNKTSYYEKEIIRNGTSHVNENELGSMVAVATPTPEMGGAVLDEPTSSKSEWDSGDEGDDDADEEVDEEEDEEPDKDNIVLVEPQDITHTTLEPKTYANMVSKNAPQSGFNINPVGSGTPTSVPPAFGQPVLIQHQSPPVQAVSPQQQQQTTAGPKPKETETLLKVSEPSGNQNSSPVVTGGRATPPSGEVSNSGSHTYHNYHGNHNKMQNRANRYNNNGRTRMENRDTTPSGNGTALNNSGGFNARLEEVGNWEGEKKKFLYPDSQQLFVGNLPHTMGEDLLKEIFGKYGNVVDMRINNKQNPKMNPGGKGPVPNFGFVIFDDTESVQKALESRPVFYNSHRLNVEEKKTKQRPMNSENNRVPPGRGMPPRGGGMGARGGRGIMRGGEARGTNRGPLRR